MREIKFRAWAGKQMWTDVAVFNNDAYVWNYEEMSLVPLFSDAQVRLYGKPILMQYSGLKDKNGREIFEGDICHYIDYYCGDHPPCFHKSGVGEVVFDEEGAFSVREATELTSAEILNLEYTVIGNVYQNPELAR